MQRLLIATTALAALIATSASAQIVNTSGLNSDPTQAQATANGGAVIGSGNSAATGGTGLGVGIAGAAANATQGQQQAAIAAQGQQQSNVGVNGQTQAATATNAGQANTQAASTTSGSSLNYSAPRNTASAIAPVVVNVASCAIGGSVAGQGPGFGFSLGAGRIDAACDRRANAQILFQLGETEAAVQYLSAGDASVSKAVTAARTSAAR